MSKKFKIIIGAVILVVGLFVFSGKANAAGPWDDVWAAITQVNSQIADLYGQIATIELIPGPTGSPGPSGPPGPSGQPGPTGPPGPALSGINKDLIYVVSSVYTNVTPGLATIVRASCNDNNDPLLSGGFHVSPPQFNHVTVVSNSGMPTDSIASWTVAAITDGTNNLDLGQIQAEAYCLRVDY